MQVVRWLQENTEPDALIAAHDIGLITYFSGRKVLDLVGLTDPEVAMVYAATPPPCRGGHAERAQRLYDLLAERRPAIVYFHPDWNRQYMGLLTVDGGRHLKHVHTMEKKMGTWPREVKVHEYRFFKTDWDAPKAP